MSERFWCQCALNNNLNENNELYWGQLWWYKHTCDEAKTQQSEWWWGAKMTSWRKSWSWSHETILPDLYTSTIFQW
jgi:hypothetical protein